MFPAKRASQRVVMGFRNDAFSHPLPELRLRRPKLLSVFTDYQRGFLLLLFLLFRSCSHFAQLLSAIAQLGKLSNESNSVYRLRSSPQRGEIFIVTAGITSSRSDRSATRPYDHHAPAGAPRTMAPPP